MKTERAYVYRTERAPRALMALECTRITKDEAKVPAHVSLESLAPGMVFRLAQGRKPDKSSSRVITRLDRRTSGLSTISFGPGVPADDEGPKPEPPA